MRSGDARLQIDLGEPESVKVQTTHALSRKLGAAIRERDHLSGLTDAPVREGLRPPPEFVPPLCGGDMVLLVSAYGDAPQRRVGDGDRRFRREPGRQIEHGSSRARCI